ncbi:PRD1 [Candida oxycetoniae]|uniref:PRD1 n=1 Tax=Candida oxycetoniae TaxID=497107 RepID=A0AAI9T0L5_9ASCO|nr:PRD1 [Candida oxycetoniae]KAI3406409.2 PRD1 [Candida oxycetoniae]
MSLDLQKLAQEQKYPKWEQTSQEVLESAKDLASRETQLFDQIANVSNPSISNTLEPFGRFFNENAFVENQITFYQYVSNDKELRDASTAAEEILDKNSIEQWSREDVYKTFKQLSENLAEKRADSDAEDKRYVDKIITAFKRNGLALPNDQREKVKQLQVELSNLKVQFSKNLNEDNGCIYFTLEELDGVPQDVIGQYEKDNDNDKYRVTFKYPDIFPIFKYAKNSNTRKRANIAYGNRCSEKNDEILTKIIKIRYDIAKELGYDTFSDYVLEERMAKTKKTVLDFLGDLRTKLKPVAEKELENLKSLKASDLEKRQLQPEDEFYAWDFNFYNENLLAEKYQIDNNKIAEYFPLQSTIEKMLEFYEKIFDIKFVKLDPQPNEIWHKDVQQFAIFQNIKFGTVEYMGAIYFDLHPRVGKYGHAANFGLGPGYLKADGKTRRQPVTALVCNFTKPTKDKPSLLKHDEVVTFFHELGHGIHSILAQTKYSRFHGTSVERDFVETPSQMLEYWCWSKNEIKKLSSHYETGEPINDDLVDQLVRTKHVNTGLFNLRQLFFGLFDMTVHTINNKEQLESLDLFKIWNNLKEEVTLLPSDNNPTKGYASFGHIAGGYESGYYGYLYSLVFAADIYYTLFKKDPMNTENGIRYRDIILRRGGSRDIMENLEELLGRKPNSEAFLKEIFG